MSVSKIAEELYNDGEGLDYTDLNTATRKIRSEVWDWVVGMLERSGGENNVGNSADTALYSVGGGGAPRTTGTASKVAVYGGTIMQIGGGAANLDGSEPYFVPYALAFDEISQTFTANSSGNPRYDIIQVKIDYVSGDSQTRDFKDASTGALSSVSVNKKRNSRVTASVKEGTPAGSPTEPSPDSGYVKLCSVRINNGHTTGTVITADKIKDYRMPVGNPQRLVMPCRSMIIGIASQWFSGGLGESPTFPTAQGGAARTMYIAPNAGPRATGRLVRVGLGGNLVDNTSTATAKLYRIDASTGNQTSLKDLTSALIPTTSGAFWREVEISEAWWTNGYQAGAANLGASEDGVLSLQIVSSTSADAFTFGTFEVVGM